MKLTAATIKTLTLPAGVPDRIFFDEDLPRFGVRVRAGGSRTWVVQYGIGGKERKLPLGPVTALDPSKARALAKDLLARVRLGEDPLAAKQEAAAHARETFGAQLPRYLAFKRKSLRPRSYSEIERHLLSHAKPLHGRSLASLATDRRQVAVLLGNISEASGPAAANMVRSSLSACCAWLMREGLLDANPIIATNKAPQAAARDRVLADAELQAIWRALDDDRFGAVVRLLTLTGLRREEIGGLRWCEVDFDQEMLRLPAERCKNRRPHDVPLSRPALDILQAQPREGAAVFGPFQAWGRSKRQLDRKLASTVAPWRLHDLRRTVSTVMHDRLEVAPHVVEAVLGHYSGHRAGVAGTYNRAAYADQKRVALDKWADLLERIVSGKKPATVVKMPRRK
jgi:integrase